MEQLGPSARFYKVGLQLLTAEGPAVVLRLISGGKEVVLDLKLNEIPTSVAGAVAAAGALGAYGRQELADLLLNSASSLSSNAW